MYLPLLGVEPLPVVPFPPAPFEPELKVPAIDAVAGDRPAVWIDDNHTAAGRRWSAARPLVADRHAPGRAGRKPPMVAASPRRAQQIRVR